MTRRSFWSCLVARLAFAASLAVLAPLSTRPAVAHETFDVVVGNFCVGDLPVSSRKVTRSILNNGNSFEDWKIAYSARKSELKPYIKFLKSVSGIAVDATCRELEGSPLLEGQIVELKLVGRWSQPGNNIPARVTIPADGLSMKIQRVTSGIALLLGGSMDLAGSAAWVENPEPLTSVDGQPLSGTLDIESWSRRITGAKFALDAGDVPSDVELWSGNRNVTIRVSADGSTARLIDGRLDGSMPEIHKDQLAFPQLTFMDATLRDGRLTVDATEAWVDISIDDSAIVFASAVALTNSSSVTLGAGTGSIGSIHGGMTEDQAVITFAERTAEDVSISDVACHLQMSALTMLEAPACNFALTSTSADESKLQLSATAPTQVGLPGVSPKAATTVAMQLSVADETDTFAAQVSDFDELLGTARFAGLPELNIPPTILGNATVEIPIDLEVPPGTGDFSLETSEGLVTLTGTLAKFRLHGVIHLDLVLPEIALVIPTRGLEFDASALVALQPVVLAAQTQFVGVGIAFSNVSEVHVGTRESYGKILFQPEVVSVLNPSIVLGIVPGDCDDKDLKGCGLTVHAPASFEVGAEFLIDIRRANVRPHTGHLAIENANAVVETGRPATLGEVRVEDGIVHFDRLVASFENGKGFAEMSGLEVAAKRLSSVPQMEGGKLANQVQWDATDSSLKAGRISAEAAPSAPDDDLKVQNMQVFNACVNSSNGHLGKVDALQVSVASFELCVDTWTDALLTGHADVRNGRVEGQIDEGEGSLVLRRLLLNVTGGTPDKPDGTGSIQLGPIHATLNSPIDPKWGCRGEPDFKKIQARVTVDSAAAGLAFNLNDGKPDGKGTALLVTAKIRSTEKYDCTQEIADFEIVPAIKVEIPYPCPTWRKPWRWCTEVVETPAVKIGVDSRIQLYDLVADVLAVDPFLKLGTKDDKTQLKICAGNLTAFNTLIAVSYVFQPHTGVPDFDKFTGDLMGIVAAPFQSAVVSALGNTLLSTITILRLFDLGTFCTN